MNPYIHRLLHEYRIQTHTHADETILRYMCILYYILRDILFVFAISMTRFYFIRLIVYRCQSSSLARERASTKHSVSCSLFCCIHLLEHIYFIEIYLLAESSELSREREIDDEMRARWLLLCANQKKRMNEEETTRKK